MIRAVTEPRLFATRYPSPQPLLDGLTAVEWHPALRLPRYRARLRPTATSEQARPFPLDEERQRGA